MSRPLMEHQEWWLNETWERPFWAFFHATGTGKSAIVVHTAARLFEAGRIDACVVVTMNHIHREWAKNIPLDCDAPYLIATPENKEPWEMLRYIDAPELVFLAFNVEKFNKELNRAWLMRLLQEQRVLLVVDESTMIKNPATKRFKFLFNAASRAPYRRILSGTPATESPFDLWAQAAFLGWHIFNRRFANFKAHFGVPSIESYGSRRWTVYKEYRHLDELRANLKTWSSVVPASVLNLDAPVRRTIPIILNAKQRAAYGALKAMELRPDITSVIDRVTRLREITSGYYTVKPGNLMLIDDKTTPKLEALSSLLAEIPRMEQVVIRCQFRYEAEMVAEHIGPTALLVHGGVRDVADRFTTFSNGTVQYLVVTYGIGTHGVNWQNANHCIFYSPTWSHGMRAQSEARIYRKGQIKRCHFYDLEAEGTIDSVITACVNNKAQLAAYLLARLETITDRPNDVRHVLVEKKEVFDGKSPED